MTKNTAVLTAIRWLVSSGSWAAVLLAVPQDFTCFPLLHLQVRFVVALEVTDTACTHFHSRHDLVSSPKTKSQKHQLCHMNNCLCPPLHHLPYSPETQQPATWRLQIWCGYTATAHRTGSAGTQESQALYQPCHMQGTKRSEPGGVTCTKFHGRSDVCHSVKSLLSNLCSQTLPTASPKETFNKA